MRNTLTALLTVVMSAGSADLDVRGVVHVADKPYANAVVWLEVGGFGPRTETSRPVLDQRNLRFSPQVLAVEVGTTVAFPNNDRVFHNVFSFRDGKRFDLGLYPIGAVKLVTFDKAGISRIFCNIHPQMAAYVVAVDSPYFAVSDENGNFSLTGVPAGPQTYRAWRPGAASITGAFAAEPGRQLDVRWP